MKKKIEKNEENYNSSIKIIYDNKYYFFSMETYFQSIPFSESSKAIWQKILYYFPTFIFFY